MDEKARLPERAIGRPSSDGASFWWKSTRTTVTMVSQIGAIRPMVRYFGGFTGKSQDYCSP
jgi:hypothetical protein